MESKKLPPIIPEYRKPEKPGIWMSFGNTVALYHIVAAGDDFEKAGQDVFNLVKEAQERFPDWPRVLYLDIEGHRHPRHRFDDDFIEFQQEFLFSTVAPFITGLETPLTGPLLNPDPQRNDVPDTLVVQQRPEAGSNAS